MLDDGRLTDNKGRTADFRNTIIIMTSNIGSQLIQEHFEGMGNTLNEKVFEEARAEVFELLRTTIRPEFLNRIDEIIMFKPLNREEIRQIVVLQIANIKKILENNELQLEISPDAIELLADKGYDPQYGARPLKRVLQRDLLNELSKMILAGKVSKDSAIQVGAKGGALVFEN